MLHDGTAFTQRYYCSSYYRKTMVTSRYSAKTPLANFVVAIYIIILLCLIGSSLSFTTSRQWGRKCVEPGFSFAALLSATSNDKEISTIQILMSDTGGGHRASANAIRDALDVLYPGKVHCDIVDIYTDYGPVWPYNDYVNMYKLMAKDPWIWDAFYHFGATDFGICVNAVMLENICFNAFSECISRPSAKTGRRADMVVSVHPLLQELPLQILANLDSGTRQISARTTPFCTVVTDLGSAHPTWFHPG